MKKVIDWEHIKSEYEDTFKSIRSIAKENNITHGAIQKKSKQEAWIKLDEDLIKDKYLLSEASFLDKIGIRKIREIINELGGNYSSLDEALIVAYAVNYSRWIKLQNEIDIDGVVLTSSKGGKYISPVFNASKSVEKTILNIANQLGLSIASRKRLNITRNTKNIKNTIFNIVDVLDNCDIDI